MTIITGTVKQFRDMFTTVMCGSKYPLFTSVILEINEEIISVNCTDQTRAVATNQKYTGFRIEGGNDIPIDTISIYEALKLFNDSDALTLDYEDNRIVLSANSGGKKDTITIPVSNNDGVNKSTIVFTEDSISVGGNTMVFDAHVDVDVSHIQNQIKKANFVDSLYHEYDININENKLILSVGNINSFELSSSTEIDVEGRGVAGSKYMHGYDDIFKALSGDVTIRLNENKPMLVVQTTDDYSIKYLIAPIISE